MTSPVTSTVTSPVTSTVTSTVTSPVTSAVTTTTGAFVERLLPSALQASLACGEEGELLGIELATVLVTAGRAVDMAESRMLIHAPLRVLSSSAGAPTSAPRLRAAALRCLALVLSRPGVAEACLLSGWCDAQREEEVWGHTTRAVGRIAAAAAASLRNQQQHQQWQHQPPGHASLPQQEQMAQAAAEARNEAELALNACMAVLGGVSRRPPEASVTGEGGGVDEWRRACEARESAAALRAEARAFNADAKAAVARWRANGWLGAGGMAVGVGGADDTIEAEAGAALGELIFALPGLSPPAVGDYLSRPGAFQKAALAAFFGCFDFSSLPLDGALRLAFAALHVPGEAQKVDRIVNAIAHAYFRQRPGPFADATSAYVMAFSAMLLNTDQHNANVRNKMTLEQFIKNNRKINAGEDLPREYLEGLYHAIASNEIKAHELPPPTPPPSSRAATAGGPAAAQPPPQQPATAAQPEFPSLPSVARWTYLHQRALRPAIRLGAPTAAVDDGDDSPTTTTPVPPPVMAPLQRSLVNSILPAVLELCAALVSAPDTPGGQSTLPLPRPPPADPVGKTAASVGRAFGLLGSAIQDSHGRRHEHTQHQQPHTQPPSPQLQHAAALPSTAATAASAATSLGHEPWALALRAVLQSLKLCARLSLLTHAAHAPSSDAPPSLVDRIVVMLCDASPLGTALPHLPTDPAAIRACTTPRAISLASAAIAIARALPAHLGRDGWRALLRTLLALHQLQLSPEPLPPHHGSAPLSPIDDASRAAADAAESGVESGTAAASESATSREEACALAASPPTGTGTGTGTSAAAAAAEQAIDAAAAAVERLLAGAWPLPTDPPWQQARAHQQLVHEAVRPAALLRSGLSSSGATQHLVPAALQTVDDTMHLALATHHRTAEAAAYASMPAARSLSLLAALVEQMGERAPPWALPAATDRMTRALATPQCPSAVHAAAAHALERLRRMVQPQQAQRAPPPQQQPQPQVQPGGHQEPPAGHLAGHAPAQSPGGASGSAPDKDIRAEDFYDM